MTDTGAYFTYFDSIPWDGFEFYIADHAFTGVFPTNDGAACVWVVASGDAIEAVRAEHGADEVGFHQLVRAARPVSPIVSSAPAGWTACVSPCATPASSVTPSA